MCPFEHVSGGQEGYEELAAVIRVISGLSSFVLGILVGILILPFLAGLPPWPLGFGWITHGWCLSLPFLWISTVEEGSSGPCSFLVFFVVLKPLFWLLIACASCGPPSIRLLGLDVSRWLV